MRSSLEVGGRSFSPLRTFIVGGLLASALATVSRAQDQPLWTGTQPPPTAVDIPQLPNVEFHVIQQRAPEKDGFHWLHGVALAWHHNKLFASFGRNRGAENTASETAQIRVSTDGGVNWGPVVQLEDAGEPNRAISHGVFLEQDGKLWALHASFAGRLEQVCLKGWQLDDASGRWTFRGVVARNAFWPVEVPQQLDNGNWIVGGLIVAPGTPAGVALSHGADVTRWDVVAIPKPAELNMWGEATLLRVGADLLCIARYSVPRALTAVSHDAGRSWSTVRESNLPMAASKPFAGRLSTGHPYLIGCLASDGGNRRSPLIIALGAPGEASFRRMVRIRDAVCAGPGESHENAALSYPYAVEHDGKLYIGYSNDGGRGANLNSAELAIVPLDSLQ